MDSPNKYSSIMSAKTDAELITIVTVDSTKYETLAIEAAHAEIQSRNIDLNKKQDILEDAVQRNEEETYIEKNKASSISRFVHLIVDSMAFWLIAIIITFPVEKMIPHYMKDLKYTMVLVSFTIAFFGYFMVMEFFFQKTLGKFLTGTKVVDENGNQPSLSEIFGRTLCRLVPFDRLSFLFLKNGLHDNLSKTYVVKDTKRMD